MAKASKTTDFFGHPCETRDEVHRYYCSGSYVFSSIAVGHEIRGRIVLLRELTSRGLLDLAEDAF